MRKIGIFGGTFNPVHNVHLRIAEAAKKELSLDEVWLLPSGTPPHKKVDREVSSFDRLSMCEIAAAESGIPGIFAKDFEMNDVLPNYSYKTVSYLSEAFPDDKFFFILGEDSLRYFHRWKHPEIISAHATVVAAVRAGFTMPDGAMVPDGSVMSGGGNESSIDDVLSFLSNEYPGEFYKLSLSPSDLSSTKIRAAVPAGDMAFLSANLSAGVLSYITEHGLYRTPVSMEEIEDIRKAVKKKLKASRYRHTLGVMHTAGALSMRYSYPVNDAILAGLLHDCTKYLSDEEQLSFCKKHKIKVTASEKSAPHLLHAKTGAYVAKHTYGVKDPAILHAIQVHTTGVPDMHLLDKILFVADYIEPHRDSAPRLSDIRKIAFSDLDLAVTMILSDTIHYLTEKAQSMDPTTLESFAFYRKIIEARGDDLTLRVSDAL